MSKEFDSVFKNYDPTNRPKKIKLTVEITFKVWPDGQFTFDSDDVVEAVKAKMLYRKLTGKETKV